MSQQVHYFVSMPVYPQNSVQPQCRTRSKPNLNIIFVLIIVTDAQVFETVKKYGGQGYLAAPYCVLRLTQAKKCNTECVYRLKHFHTIGLMGQSYGKEIIHLNFTLVNVMAVINVMLL